MSEIKLVPAICPQCGAKLDVPDDSHRLYCMYCGTQIILGKIDSPRKIECNVCDGYGRVEICRACDGSGDCTWSTRSSGFRSDDIFMLGYVARCDGGICSACNGTGRYKLGACPGCNGTGRCPQCLGTGKCMACRGAGAIPNPQGHSACENCHGTGLMEPGSSPKPKKPLPDKCINCGGMLRPNDSYCPFCGYVKRRCPQCDSLWVEGAPWCEKCGFGKKPEQKST